MRIASQLKRFVTAFTTAAVLGIVGCGTNVPLTQEAQTVETPSSQGQQGGGSTAGGAAEADLRQVQPLRSEPVPSMRTSIVYFDFDSYIVRPEFQSVLDEVAKTLRLSPMLKVSLAGHTDDLGGREYNLALGQKRAEAVRHALNLLGVREAQMEAISFGKEKPAMEGMDEQARSRNRRVEILGK